MAIRFMAVVVALTLGLSARAGDIESILDGVQSIAAPGVPGTVSAWGERAVVVVDAPTGARAGRQAVVAVARAGRGKAVVFGHDGYLNPTTLAEGDTARLLLNLIRWGTGGRAGARVAVVGLPRLAEYLKGKDVDAVAVARNDWRQRLAGHAVAILPAGVPADDGDVKALRAFMDGGGTIVVAQTGWGWLQTRPGKSLGDDLPANALLAPMGLAIGDGMVEKDRRTNRLSAAKPPAAVLNGKAALELLVSAQKGGDAGGLLRDRKDDLSQAAATLTHACRAFPADAAVLGQLRAAAGDTANLPLPTFAKPLRDTDGLARVMLAAQLREIERTPIERLKAHPAAAAFPGAVPAGARRVTQKVAVDLSVPRWHSTGLYAAPGEVVTVTLPANAVGLRVRIGAHTDRTYHLAAWRRAPEVSRAFNLDAPVTRTGNAFGGLIYVEVPETRASEGAGSIDVTIANALPAPRFVLGKTAPAEWRNQIRSAPAPWAELETSKLIITLKSEAVRGLDDPTPVLEHWDRVMDACATLAARPTWRRSPERIVSDADISAGYMHAGYPIMTGLDVTDRFADLRRLKTVNDGWGFYHELGHNHQVSDWTFEGTTEVTVNLFSMYVLETVCGLPKEQSTRRALVDPAKRIEKYLAAPSFDAWKADPFLALAMYAQVRNEFGWEPYTKVFAEYRALPADGRPKTEEQKRDQWMARLSRAVGRNLGPFFEAWGVPTTEAARRSVADLPGWMPAGMAKR